MAKAYVPKSKMMKSKAGRKPVAKKTGLSKLARDVAILKRSNNAERKYIKYWLDPATVGQVNVNSSGHYLVDITPGLVPGNTVSTRVGNSVKLTSMAIKYQLTQQGNAQHPMRLRFYVFRRTGATQTVGATTITELFDPNQFINPGSVYDTTCDRDAEKFRNWVVMRKWSEYIQPDKITGQTMLKTGNVAFKCSSHIRYDGGGSTSTYGQMLLLVLADSGNMGGSASTLNGVNILGANTGAIINWAATARYVDN